MEINVLIGGAAGQGLATLGLLLSRSLVRAGYYIVVTQSYQSRIRGGHNSFAIRASATPISAPGERVDILVALDDASVAVHSAELVDGSLVVADATCSPGSHACLPVPYEELGEKRARNVVGLGVVGALLGLDPGPIEALVEKTFGKKDPELATANRATLRRAYEWARQRDNSAYRLPPVSSPGRLLLNGNDAIALGAVSAGVKFCSFYPMTPSTSIALNLAAWAPEFGLVVEQAEDEIAALNMAIGAAFAGAPSLVPTSGGGFALMAEAVSLAAMTETPVVIVVAQRPGPATGLPTRTEQGDLEFVLHAGHGEFPRAILTPGTVEECFALTRRAFELANRYQGPVFVMTDQFLADSYRAVTPLPLEPPVDRGIAPPPPAAQPYARYADSPSGISPRLVPGTSSHLVVADSDEHDQYGHITEDLALRVAMQQKRMRKHQGLAAEVLSPVLEGSGTPEILLLSWGSTRGAVLEAAARLRRRGMEVAAMHLPQVWPLPAAAVHGACENSTRVVCVEGNYSGQLARLLRRETGFQAHQVVGRYDGLPITPGYIIAALEEGSGGKTRP